MKSKLFIFILMLIISAAYANDVVGFWQTIDKKTKLPSSIIAVYPYGGKYYGKIIATYNQQGNISDTIYNPTTRAPGVAGKPYYCGLDIIWGCTSTGNGVYKGYVVDPREGKKYTAKIWAENGNLILRGELMMFGRNEILVQFPEANFNQSFAQPNLSKFIPSSYKLK